MGLIVMRKGPLKKDAKDRCVRANSATEMAHEVDPRMREPRNLTSAAMGLKFTQPREHHLDHTRIYVKDHRY